MKPEFNFDTFSRGILDQMHQEGKTLKLVIKPTSPAGIKNRIVDWDADAELVVKYIEKRRSAVSKVENLRITKENKMIKLTWDGVDDEAFKGYYVVRNSFHPPDNREKPGTDRYSRFSSRQRSLWRHRIP